MSELNKMVKARMAFERPEIQVKAFWSNIHDGFYIVTGFGFPCNIYVKHLNRWFGAENDLMSAQAQRKVTPDVEIEVVHANVLTDIYRRGVAGLAKQLTDVLQQIAAAAPPETAGSPLDELAERRDRRGASPPRTERPAR